MHQVGADQGTGHTQRAAGKKIRRGVFALQENPLQCTQGDTSAEWIVTYKLHDVPFLPCVPSGSTAVGRARRTGRVGRRV